MLETILNFDLSIAIRLEAIQQYLGPKFKCMGMGKDRITFLSPNKRFVLKFPKDESGISANECEAYMWKHNKRGTGPDGIYYAPCRMLKNHILMMWAVTELSGGTEGCDVGRAQLGGKDHYDYGMDDGTPTRESNLPEWVASVDCCQVGYLRNGRLAAYDYGD